MRRTTRWVIICLLLLACPARGQEHPSGTIEKIQDSGTVYLGSPMNSVPFGFRADGQFVGYSIDLCQAIITELSTELGKPINIEYRPVNAQNRFSELVSGNIDLLCGSTTNTPERQKQVAFSPVIFVTSIKLLVKENSMVTNLRNLRGKIIALTRNTTTEKLQDLIERQTLQIKFSFREDYNQSRELFLSGRADAFAYDDVLLHGWLASSGMTGKYRIVDDSLSYEPYGLAYRNDDFQFADLVERTFQKIAKNGDIFRLYKKWFMEPLPSGVTLDMPISAELKDNFDALALMAE